MSEELKKLIFEANNIKQLVIGLSDDSNVFWRRYLRDLINNFRIYLRVIRNDHRSVYLAVFKFAYLAEYKVKCSEAKSFNSVRDLLEDIFDAIKNLLLNVRDNQSNVDDRKEKKVMKDELKDQVNKAKTILVRVLKIRYEYRLLDVRLLVDEIRGYRLVLLKFYDYNIMYRLYSLLLKEAETEAMLAENTCCVGNLFKVAINIKWLIALLGLDLDELYNKWNGK